MKALKPSGRMVGGTSSRGASFTTSAGQNTENALYRVRLGTTATRDGWAEPTVGSTAFSTCSRSHDISQVDASERENLQIKVREAQVQIQVAKEALAKYRERENEIRADEVSIGKQLVRTTFLAVATVTDFQLARTSR